MAKLKKWGSEFLVNTTTTADQENAAVTALPNGRFVVTWGDGSQSGGDTSLSAVRGQMFNADGSKFGAEFLVNTATVNDQTTPDSTALEDGRFVVVWTDWSGDASGAGVRAQIFNADGSKSGAEFLVNTKTDHNQLHPTATTLGDGRFVVAWDNWEADDVYAQVFNADGTKSGSEFLVNTTTDGRQDFLEVASLAGGGFAIAWSDEGQSADDPSEWAVRGQIFNADGGKSGGEFLVNTTTNGNQFFPAIAGLTNGRFVVTWNDGSQDTSEVRGQVFNADGTKSGKEFRVSTQNESDEVDSAVVALAEGRFVVAWSNDGGGITAQLFRANGKKSGDEVQINTSEALDQYDPAITALADGRLAIVWQNQSSTGGDTSGEAVRARILDPRNKAVKLDGTALDDDFVGTKFKDKLGGAAGDDHLVGGRGKDKLGGGAGNDFLDGGRGDDRFLFAAALDAATNVDHIAHFRHGHDQIRLDDDVFTGLDKGKLDGDAFFARKNAVAAKDGEDRIIYDTKSGALYYDGDGEGGQAAQLFAVLDGSPNKLSAKDFLIVA